MLKEFLHARSMRSERNWNLQKKVVKMKINIQDLFSLLLLSALKDYRLFNTKTVSMGLRVYVMCENKM